MHYDEAACIAAIQQGNKNAFADIYEHYVDVIYNFVARKVDTKQDVEDLVSHIFYKAFQNIEKCCSQENPHIKSRLYMIARNSIIDFYKSKKAVLLNEDIQAASTEQSPLQQTQTQVLSDTIMHYIRQLGEDVYDIFIMRFRNQLSYAEITAINGKTEGNNKKIFSRTCKQLREQFPLIQV